MSGKAVSTVTVTGTSSLSGGGDLSANRTLSLVNDTSTPGATRYYGTDGSGVKGYHALPPQDPVLGGDLTGSASNAQLAVGVVGANELATNAVTTTKITDTNVTTSKIADAAITDVKIATGISQSKVSNLVSDLSAKAAVVHTHSTTDITSGTMAPARLGGGTPSVTTYLRGDGSWVAPALGENNTASNVGTAGVGIFKQKTGVNLEFKNVNAASNKISVTNDVANNEIDIDVVTANLGLTKTDVGLANVDNTSDANKPVSTATQTALNAKVATSSVGSANGVASLDGSGKVPIAQLPAVSVGYADLPAGSMVTVFKSGAVWPVRPTSRNDIAVRWRGAAPGPSIGGSYAVDGVDDWDEV